MGFFSCALPRVTLLSSYPRGWYAYFRPRGIFHQPFLENAACFCSTNRLVHGKLLSSSSSSSLAQLTWDCTAICTNSGCYWCTWTGPIPLHALSFFFFFHSLFHSLTKRVNLLWIFARSFFFPQHALQTSCQDMYCKVLLSFSLWQIHHFVSSPLVMACLWWKKEH